MDWVGCKTFLQLYVLTDTKIAAWSNVLEGLETVLQDCPNSKIPPDTPEHSL
jgi:hypothetical protein